MQAIANHLWQLTLFAGAAALLSLVLRRNRAADRYRLWLLASLKFLVPFSLLTAFGRHWPVATSLAGFGTWISPVEQELGPAVASPLQLADLFAHPGGSPIEPSPLLIGPSVVAWLTGFIYILSGWYRRHRRLSDLARRAVLLKEGREVDALRKCKSGAGSWRPVALLLTESKVEPGVFGAFRPVLLWPKGISAHLNDAQLDAIMAHEVSHVRRRDNLASLAHMLVEAIFWFYPLVWWLGARLIDERERACDEGVLEAGSDRTTYAEGLLKACQFCIGFPVRATTSVTGADLRKRIREVMSRNTQRRLGAIKTLLLGVTGAASVAMPLVSGALDAAYSADVLSALASGQTSVLLTALANARERRESPSLQAGFQATGIASPPRCPDPRDIRLACGGCRHPILIPDPVAIVPVAPAQVLASTLHIGGSASAFGASSLNTGMGTHLNP